MITGAQLATLRALIAIALVLIAALFDRPLRLLDALGVAALAILVWRPADLFDPSFQLSFVAALTLALGAGAASPARGVRGWLVRGIATSAWVAITTAPFTAFHFQQVAAGGVVGNLVLTPLVELVALPLGLAGARARLSRRRSTARGMDRRRRRSRRRRCSPRSRRSATSRSPAPVVMTALVALSLGLARARRAAARIDRGAVARAVPGLVARRARRRRAGALRVTFLDVGQGDAALIELPDGAVW